MYILSNIEYTNVVVYKERIQDQKLLPFCHWQYAVYYTK